MKNFLLGAVVVLAAIWLLGECTGCGSESVDEVEAVAAEKQSLTVESLYGTYTGVDRFGNNIKIVLMNESYNDYKKWGRDYSDNLVWKDSQGRLQSCEFQTIKWDWSLAKGYSKVSYDMYERYVIDFKREKIYCSYGEYLDDRNGIPYTYSK